VNLTIYVSMGPRTRITFIRSCSSKLHVSLCNLVTWDKKQLYPCL